MLFAKSRHHHQRPHVEMQTIRIGRSYSHQYNTHTLSILLQETASHYARGKGFGPNFLPIGGIKNRHGLASIDRGMSSKPFSLPESFKKNVWLVAFDMDQTSLDIHTTGVVVKENEVAPPEYQQYGYNLLNAKEVLTHVKDAIKVIIPELLKNGIMVAICTNTDVLMAQNRSLMGGRELVEYIMGNTFDQYPDICDHLIIEAWRGSLQAVRVVRPLLLSLVVLRKE